MPANHSRRFLVDHQQDGDGFYYSLDGAERRGPFPSDIARERDFLDVLARWRRRAQQLGGSLVRTTARTFIVTLPVEHPIDGGEDLSPRPGRTLWGTAA